MHPVVSLKPGSPTLCWLVAMGQTIFTGIKNIHGRGLQPKMVVKSNSFKYIGFLGYPMSSKGGTALRWFVTIPLLFMITSRRLIVPKSPIIRKDIPADTHDKIWLARAAHSTPDTVGETWRHIATT